MTVALPVARTTLQRAAGAPEDNGDLGFDTHDFERVCSLIRARAGIHLLAGKRAMVYSRLSRHLRETGHHSFGAYLESLDAAKAAGRDHEWQTFVNCLTTNLTAFFREEHHFHALADELAARTDPRLRIWSSAASTGEEPYSIAMAVAEARSDPACVSILASDVDTDVLASAELGVYAADARGLTPARLRAHCLRGTGSKHGAMRIKPELARRVEFRQHNLIDARWSLGEPFDIVFCRNVLIYFDAATQREVLGRIHAVMKPDGLLFVGHSENFTDLKGLFRLRGKTIYERI